MALWRWPRTQILNQVIGLIVLGTTISLSLGSHEQIPVAFVKRYFLIFVLEGHRLKRKKESGFGDEV